MTSILQINSSLNKSASVSSKLAGEFGALYAEKVAKANIVVRDVAENPVPHIDLDTMTAFQNPKGELTEKQRQSLTLSDSLIQELKAADILVIAAPLYNLGIPSTLKAWFDHVMRAKETFAYTGPSVHEGFLKDKKAFIISSRGGEYAGTEIDVQTPQIRNSLTFMGITDIQFIYAEGLSFGSDHYASSLANASRQMQSMLATV